MPISRAACSSVMPGSTSCSTLRNALRGEGGRKFEGGELVGLVDGAQAVTRVHQKVCRIDHRAVRSGDRAQRVGDEGGQVERRLAKAGVALRQNGFQPMAPMRWPAFRPQSARMSASAGERSRGCPAARRSGRGRAHRVRRRARHNPSLHCRRAASAAAGQDDEQRSPRSADHSPRGRRHWPRARGRHRRRKRRNLAIWLHAPARRRYAASIDGARPAGITVGSPNSGSDTFFRATAETGIGRSWVWCGIVASSADYAIAAP